MKVLSKSRFKLGLQCPNKLFFTSKKNFINAKNDDPFLAALAKGGFQVEELAKLHYPGGVEITGPLQEYQQRAMETAELLKQNQVIIYEAAFLYNNWFVRTDILIKDGNHIKIVEVKAKGYHPTKTKFVTGKKADKLDSKLKPYILDLAFQTFVVRQCLPHCFVDAAFMMADQSKQASIDGLNQLFRISDTNSRVERDARVSQLSQTGAPVLSELPMTDLINAIIAGQFVCHENFDFQQTVNYFTQLYVNDQYANTHVAYSKCRKCEFKKEKQSDLGLSGVEHCLGQQQVCAPSDLYVPNIFDVWKLGVEGQKLLATRKVQLNQVVEADIKVSEQRDKLSSSARKWIQISKSQLGDDTPYIMAEPLRATIANWNFPYHFIDFETSAVALPFMSGMRPYEQVAFQYSHHVMHSDGRIEHAGQLLVDTPGKFPNFDFVRKLKQELEIDQGTIFRYSHHENSILVAIAKQLERSQEKDRAELIAFIQSITKSTKDSATAYLGERCMVDLCEVVVHYFYHPAMKGSNSIKSVLPAILNSSRFLQAKYSQSIGSLQINSLNFGPEHMWGAKDADGKIDPYHALPPIFEGWEEDEMEDNLSDMDEVSNGGAALTAYSKLQFSDMQPQERQALKEALLKYCELDTLAMVMLVEELRQRIN
jgi:hypothetical protein